VGELKPITISLQLADRSVKYPLGILGDVPLQVGKFSITCDFVVMEMTEDSRISIILRRPFLVTTGAMIDVKNGMLSVQVGDEKMEFSLTQVMASPTSGDSCCSVDVLEKALNQEGKARYSMEDSLEVALVGCCATNSHSGEKEEYARLLNKSTAYMPRQSRRGVLCMEEPTSKKEEECLLTVELKPLPSHLRYEFFDPSHQFSVIVSAKLNGPQLEQLLDVLCKHKGAVGYSIYDIWRLSPSFYMHHIFLDDGHHPSR